MCPVYLNLAAPVAKVAGVPTVLWYVHPGVDAGLRLAARLADGIATCYPGSFPLRVGSVRAIGHGIDVGAFAGVPPPADGRFRLLVLGRTSPEKGIPTALRAWAKVRGDTELRIVGPAPMPGDRLHRAELARMLADLDPTGDARLEDGVPPSRVPDLLAWADVLVSPMVAGSGDKVVFEAMAAGRVVVASNPVFGPLLDRHGLRFAPDDDRALATLLERLASTPRSDRAAVGADLRTAVRREHSLDSWADGMLSLVGDLRGTR
jgi:glycosyltransferase involved in cell wall biosynthesis